MRRLLLSVALGGALLGTPTLAGEGCACGDEGCEQACTCSAGVCPLHRPGKASAPKAASPGEPAAGAAQKAAPAPATPAKSPGGTSAARAPAAR